MKYYFNKAGVVQDSDAKGYNLAHSADARLMAVKFAAETLRDEPDLVWKGAELRIEVTDKDKNLLFTVIVIGVDSQDHVEI